MKKIAAFGFIVLMLAVLVLPNIASNPIAADDLPGPKPYCVVRNA